MYQDALFEILTFGMPKAVFLVYSLVCKEWNLLINNRKFLQNYHHEVGKGIEKLMNPKTCQEKMFGWMEFISHSFVAEYEMGMILRRSMIVECCTDSQTSYPSNFPLLSHDVRISLIDHKGDRVSLFINTYERYETKFRIGAFVNESASEIVKDDLIDEKSNYDERYANRKTWFRTSFRNYIEVFTETVFWNLLEGYTRIALDLTCERRVRLKSRFFADYFGSAFTNVFVQKVDRTIQSVADKHLLLVKTVKVNYLSIAYKLLDMGYYLKDIFELEECCLILPTFLKRGHMEFLLEYCARFDLDYRPLIERNIRKLSRSGKDIMNFIIERRIIPSKYLFFVINSDTGEPEYERIDKLKNSCPDLICPFDVRSSAILSNGSSGQADSPGKKFLVLFHNNYSEIYSHNYLNDFCSTYPSVDLTMMKLPRRFIRAKESRRVLSTQLQRYDHVLYYFDEISYKNRDHYLGLVWKNLNFIRSLGIPTSLAFSTSNLIDLQCEMQKGFSYSDLKIVVMTDDRELSFLRLFNLIEYYSQ